MYRIFPQTVIFTYDLFTFECIYVEIMTCLQQINDRLIAWGGTTTSLLCPQALPSSLSPPVSSILFLLTFSSPHP